ncbi:MAG: flagellar biosynthesis protein FlhB [Proteobacteria bacterium]|nr:flagellar biosynthesis protein FlhB [Pseudomonadota bacterium]NOG58950.1 flagellar biosynthesis protein FlhB [Pseudomonadota bacterium]
MSSEDTSQERTEQATPKRVDEAREKGQISRSKELSTMSILMASALIFVFMGQQLAASLQSLMKINFIIERENIFDDLFLFNTIVDSGSNILIDFAPFLGLLFLVAFFAPMMVGGWLFSPQALSLKLDKLNPISGIKRLFSANSLMELMKTLAKFILIVGIAVFLLWHNVYDLLSVGRNGLESGLIDASSLIIGSFFIVCLATVLIASVDIPFQLWNHSKQLKMTKQQVKDEMKDTEGKPEVKSHIRMLQQELANRRMMEAIPEADVIITNPTHYAVALRYKPDEMSTPKLVAKGADLVAERIRNVAKENNVMIFPAPMLARALYFSTKVNQDIPAGLYLAVAQVLAYIFQLRDNVNILRGVKPKPPTDLPIPEEFQHD